MAHPKITKIEIHEYMLKKMGRHYAVYYGAEEAVAALVEYLGMS